ncbi:MAG: phosphatidylserine decarboxylase [Desulforhopalus sp.]|nr:phosphatidylserine decarboxylase [Desulforhopalus sp.]
MTQSLHTHQFIERTSRQVVTEKPIGDRSVRFLYHSLRESAPIMFRMLTSARTSSLLAFCNYDLPSNIRRDGRYLFESIGADWRECFEPLSYYDSHRKVFERRIRYWETRPMSAAPNCVASPADARILIGSLADTSAIFIKEKLFDPQELIGAACPWGERFLGGDFAVFRLTPEKYHYNHLPVSGRVETIYGIDGQYHSCNPSALIAMASLYSKNRRVVTIIDTDVPGGSQVGLVAMVEIVALMIGDLAQTYSTEGYADPRQLEPGMFVRRGCPKSLFRPGSSTTVLFFEADRIAFASDLVGNSRRQDVQSRYSNRFGRPLVETDVLVRSTIAGPATKTPAIGKAL